MKTEIPVNLKILVNEDEAAALLSLSPNVLKTLPIPRYTIEGKRMVRYRLTDLHAWAEELPIVGSRPA